LKNTAISVSPKDSNARVAQSVEHFHGKEGVGGSNYFSLTMTNTKPTIVLIHGWEVFATQEDFYTYIKNRTCKPFKEKKRRRYHMKTTLQKDDRTVIMPEMPAKQNADYTAWAIRFEKHIPFFPQQWVILIGYSLWWAFLAKWLSNNTLSVPIHQLHMIASAFDNTDLNWEDLGEFQVAPELLKNIILQTKAIHLYQSKDDPYLPRSHFEKYSEHLSTAYRHEFTQRNHFLQEDFPELLDCIYQRDT